MIHVQPLSPLTVGLTTKTGPANNYDRWGFIRPNVSGIQESSDLEN